MKRKGDDDSNDAKAPSAAEVLKTKFTSFDRNDTSQLDAVALVQEKWKTQLEALRLFTLKFDIISSIGESLHEERWNSRLLLS
jgi:hypothetical protein